MQKYTAGQLNQPSRSISAHRVICSPTRVLTGWYHVFQSIPPCAPSEPVCPWWNLESRRCGVFAVLTVPTHASAENHNRWCTFDPLPAALCRNQRVSAKSMGASDSMDLRPKMDISGTLFPTMHCAATHTLERVRCVKFHPTWKYVAPTDRRPRRLMSSRIAHQQNDFEIQL